MSTPSRKPAAIELRIEELVLHGFAPGDRYRISEAVQRELARLLGEHGVPPCGLGGEIARFDGGTFKVTSNKPEMVGAQVAQAVHGSLQR